MSAGGAASLLNSLLTATHHPPPQGFYTEVFGYPHLVSFSDQDNYFLNSLDRVIAYFHPLWVIYLVFPHQRSMRECILTSYHYGSNGSNAQTVLSTIEHQFVQCGTTLPVSKMTSIQVVSKGKHIKGYRLHLGCESAHN